MLEIVQLCESNMSGKENTFEIHNSSAWAGVLMSCFGEFIVFFTNILPSNLIGPLFRI